VLGCRSAWTAGVRTLAVRVPAGDSRGNRQASFVAPSRLGRNGHPDSLPLLVMLGIMALAMITGLQSYLGVSEERDGPMFAVLRVFALPAILASWCLLCRRDGRRFAWPLDVPSLLPVATVAWLALSSMVSDEPIGGIARALALFALVWGAFAVFGPGLIRRDGGRGLMTASFWGCVLLVSSSVLASLLGGERGWGLLDERYQGPLSATQIGPLCVAGVLSGLVLSKVDKRRSRRLAIGIGSVLLFGVLVVSRARGSYVAFLAALLSIVGLAAYRRSAAHLMVVAGCTVVLVSGAGLVMRTGLGDGAPARFLRLDRSGILDQRWEVWAANAGFWQQFPLLGVGLGGEVALSELSKRSHSAYLSTLNEGGAPALLLLLAALGIAAWRVAKLGVTGRSNHARAVGSLAFSTIVAASTLGIVETTLINAASAFNFLVWLSMGTGMFAARLDAAADSAAFRSQARATFGGPLRLRKGRRKTRRHRPYYVRALWLIFLGAVVPTSTYATLPLSNERCVVHALELLRPLRKVHYSWPIAAQWLTPGSPVLRELARVTGALSIRGETATADQVEALVVASKEAAKQADGRSPVIGINYSPWHRRFGARLPGTDTGPTAIAELELFKQRLGAIKQALANANAKHDANIEARALLLDSERFSVAEGPSRQTAAIIAKYDEIYDIAKRYFPHSRVHWYARGAFHRAGADASWAMSPYFNLVEKGDSLACQVYEVPDAEGMRQACRRTVMLAKAEQSESVTAWIALGAGYERQAGRARWIFDYDYDQRESWQLGWSVNLRSRRRDSDDPWSAVDTVVLYPSPLDARSPATFEHFIAYARGATGEEDEGSTTRRRCLGARSG
jgi:hypothetical protein